MSKLVDELMKEHSLIVELLTEVSNLGITTKEGQNKLNSAKDKLLAHLKKEDEQLYPALNKAGEADPKLKGYINTFAKDMEGISKAAVGFFAKYEQGGSGDEFVRDFGEIVATLKMRIRKEENFLYKEYDKLAL